MDEDKSTIYNESLMSDWREIDLDEFDAKQNSAKINRQNIRINALETGFYRQTEQIKSLTSKNKQLESELSELREKFKALNPRREPPPIPEKRKPDGTQAFGRQHSDFSKKRPAPEIPIRPKPDIPKRPKFRAPEIPKDMRFTSKNVCRSKSDLGPQEAIKQQLERILKKDHPSNNDERITRNNSSFHSARSFWQENGKK